MLIGHLILFVLNLVISTADPPRAHVFHVTIPSTWKQSNLVHHFRNYGAIHIAWITSNHAYVALHNREHAPIVLKTIGKLDEFKIEPYLEYKKVGNQQVNELDTFFN